MKQRVISGIVIGILAVFSLYFGGWYYWPIVAFIAVWGCYEFCKCRRRKINWLEFAIMLIGLISLFFFYENALSIILFLLVILLTLAVFDENYLFQDACATFLETIFWAIAIYQMYTVQIYNKWLIGYLLIIAFLTDVFALLTGMKFGKHKLNARISPKKTIEGAFGGWICGAIISFTYAYFCGFFGLDVYTILICSMVLPIISQIGDLSFSLIKRYYGIKDFSHLIPGHGGILDRFDSFSFVLVIFGAITTLI